MTDTRRPQRDRRSERNAAVRLLGIPEVTRGGVPVRLGRKATILLGLLLVDAAPRTRDALAALLWPDSDHETARAALRNALTELRGAIGEAVVADRQTVAIDRAQLEVDLQRVDAALDRPERGALAEAAALARGELLAGVHGDAPELDDWLLFQRDAWHRKIARALALHADAELDAGAIAAAVTAGARRVAHEPLAEAAHRRLMELHAAAGDREAAVRAYETFAALLARELGAKPSAETQALAKRLCDEPVTATPRASPVVSLPRPPTPLLGRDALVASAAALLAQPDVRLLTLSGPGGVGKTRLALAVAKAAARDFPDGTHFVSVAALRDPELVLPAVVRALGLAEDTLRAPVAQLSRHLAGKRTLIVIDNLEQVVAAAEVLAELLAGCAGPTLLVTSRIVLRLRGEHVLAVAPLDDATAPALFAARAREAAPALDLDADELAAIDEICRRLDGLPLAIELAAARVRTLAPTAMLARLGARLPLLTGGPRDLPARQRTLRDTLTWSAELLGDDERALLRALAVFPGAFTLDGVEAVAGGDALDRLDALVDHSLVVRDGARFTMLETIRELAAEELAAAGAEEPTRRRHASWLGALVARAVPRIHGGEQAEALAELAALHDDLRVALRWCLTSAPADGLALAGNLMWYWHLRGHWHEGRAAIAHALAAAPDAPAEVRGRALAGAGVLACAQEDFAAARPQLDEALALLGARDRDRAHALGFRSIVGLYARDATGLAPVIAESLAIFEELGDRFGAALSRLRQAICALIDEDFASSIARASEALAGFRALDNAWGTGAALQNLAEAHLGAGDLDAAEATYLETFAQFARAGSGWYATISALGYAGVIAARGDTAGAARLLGACHAELAATRGVLPPIDRFTFDRNVAAVRAALAPEDFEAGWAEGERRRLGDLLPERAR